MQKCLHNLEIEHYGESLDSTPGFLFLKKTYKEDLILEELNKEEIKSIKSIKELKEYQEDINFVSPSSKKFSLKGIITLEKKDLEETTKTQPL